MVRKGKFNGPKGSKDVAVKTMNSGTMREDDFIEEALIMMYANHLDLDLTFSHSPFSVSYSS